MGGHEQIRVLKDLDARRSRDRDVVLVEDVVDTGLTLHYLVPHARAAEARARSPSPRSSTGRTGGSSTTCRSATSASSCPDELFVGYGFDLDERYRNLPDLRLLRASSRRQHAGYLG